MSTKVFCPIIREECKSSQCIMWKNENCLMVKFLFFQNEIFSEDSAEGIQHDDDKATYLSKYEIERQEKENMQKELISRYKEMPIQLLVDEFICFIKKLLKNKNGDKQYVNTIYVGQYSNQFWYSKGIDSYINERSLKALKLETESLASKKLKDEVDHNRKLQLDIEKDKLAQFIGLFHKKFNGNRRITKQDVELFLLENRISLLPETERLLYLTLNSELDFRVSRSLKKSA